MDEVTQRWSLAGNLKSNRERHNVIYDGSMFMVVGGQGSYKTENCVLEGTAMTCIEQDSYPLNYYSTHPALSLTLKNYDDPCWYQLFFK